MRITGELDALRHRVATFDPTDDRIVTTRCGRVLAFVGRKIKDRRVVDCPVCG